MTRRTVVYASDDTGVTPMLEVALWSLVAHAAPETVYRIVILANGISESSRERLLGRLPQGSVHALSFVETEEVLRPWANRLPCQHWPLTAWARLFLAELLPETSERIVYMDIDTYVCEDLGPLFDEDLGDCVIGAVPEKFYEADPALRVRLGNPPGTYRYFNSGVLLIDIDKWRIRELCGRILCFAQRPDVELLCPDQDALNGALFREIMPLHPRWNFSDGWVKRAATFPLLTPWWRGLSPKLVLEAALKPGILHFWGPHKPFCCNHRPEGWRYEATMREMGLLHGALPGTTQWKRIENAFYRFLYVICRMRLKRRLSLLKEAVNDETL